MRKTLVASIIAFVAFAAVATAQTRTEETVTTTDSTGRTNTVKVVKVGSEEDVTPRSNMITINPLKFLLFYNINYYHALSKSIVVGGGLQMPTWSGLSGFGFNAEMRWHPSGRALRGFYLAPNFSFNTITSSEETFSGPQTASATVISLGALAGWQWFPGDDFAIGLGIGVDNYWVSGEENGNEVSLFRDMNGIAPALRFDIGYAW